MAILVCSYLYMGIFNGICCACLRSNTERVDVYFWFIQHCRWIINLFIQLGIFSLSKRTLLAICGFFFCFWSWFSVHGSRGTQMQHSFFVAMFVASQKVHEDVLLMQLAKAFCYQYYVVDDVCRQPCDFWPTWPLPMTLKKLNSKVKVYISHFLSCALGKGEKKKKESDNSR